MDQTFSFLVTTDNHLGYKENDNIRRKDSYRAFEEALSIARERGVDFILLGGDLFHVNKPSANVEHRCIKIIRKHMNAKVTRPVSFKRISGKFSHCNKVNHGNFEDPNLTVPCPIFTIHGNHDDPTGPQSQSVCEKLATCGLLNYFGDLKCSDDIKVEPVVFQKDNMKIALYGMGFIPDFKLKRMFDEGKVNFVKPPEDSYNVLVVHQNRVPLNKSKYIPDEYYPNWFHLIIRGHEHASQEPTKIPESKVNGLVFQPGSTIATSISTMEAGQKQVAIISVRLNHTHANGHDMYHANWELVKLLFCRPMIFKDISQQELYKNIKDIHGDSKITSAVFKRISREFVEKKIYEYLEQFKSDPSFACNPRYRPPSFDASSNRIPSQYSSESSDSDKYTKVALSYKPILRVRLEFLTKGEKFDANEISDKLYPDLVANRDIVLFKKQKVIRKENGEVENITFLNEDDEEEDDEDFDFIDMGWEQKETIDLMIEGYFKDKPIDKRLKALSLTEYVSAVKKTGEDGNVISKVLYRKKQFVMAKYRSLINSSPSILEQYNDASNVEKYFLEEFSKENSNIAAGGDAWNDLIECE